MAQAGISGKWRVVLAVSVALNLLVIGIFVGAGWRHAAHGDRGARSAGGLAIAGPYLRALPAAAQQAFRSAAWDEGRATRRDRRQARKAEYQAVAEALRAEPFDAAAVLSLIEAQHQNANGRLDRMRRIWLGVVTDMDAATRAAYADAVIAQAERRGRPRRRTRD